ncbi:hypothetical protein [Paenibacillus turpanensis]|uniref:hypothetical protein n=1 Tax=Paenibacillus turpanensis TaxID=2689078 RepID=UPI00140A5FE0|nr:hypothetical protein [Paenibacillus turpanensis]
MSRKLHALSKGLLAAVLVLGLSACGEAADEHPEYEGYADDGYLGLSDSNPNLRTNPDHHNYRTDVRLMKEALSDLHVDENSEIFVDGADAYVRIALPQRLNAMQRETLVSDVTTQLRSWVPRYKYHVTTNQDDKLFNLGNEGTAAKEAAGR